MLCSTLVPASLAAAGRPFRPASAVLTAALVWSLVCWSGTAAALAPPPTPAGVATLGGSDESVAVHPQIDPAWGDQDMVIDSEGRIFVASRRDFSLSTKGDIVLRRSVDGGLTWHAWGYRFSNDATSYGRPALAILPGTPDRLVMAYTYDGSGDVRVNTAVSPTNVDEAQFVATEALGLPGEDYADVSIATAVGGAVSYVYLVARTNELAGADDIRFIRSTDGGLSYGPQSVVDLGSATYENARPQVAADDLGRVLIGWRTLPTGLGSDTGAKRRVLTNYGATWGSAEVLNAIGDGTSSGLVEVACQKDGSGLLTLWNASVVNEQLELDTTFYVSTAASPAGPWTTQQYAYPDVDFYNARIVPQTNGGWVLTANPTEYPAEDARWVTFYRGEGTLSPQWSDEQILSDFPFPAPYLTVGSIAVDPTREDRVALIWLVDDESMNPTVLFDAEWKGDAGVPNLEPGLYFFETANAVTHPVLADVSARSEGDEIIFGSVDDKVFVVDQYGNDLPGWPVEVGDFAQGQSLAVGDLDGDGTLEIVVPTSTGDVYVFDGEGNLREGWPVNLGTRAAHVGLAPVSKLAPLDVVAVCGDQVNLLRPNGQAVQHGSWPVTLPGPSNQPAAIGDMDGDGHLEVAVVSGAVSLFDASGAHLWSDLLGGDAASAPVSLGDLDGDGDLEAVVPTLGGAIFAFGHDGSTAAGVWPVFVAGTGSLNSIALANVDGVGGYEVGVTRRGGVVALYTGFGDTMVGWPMMPLPGAQFVAPPIFDDIDGLGAELLAANDEGFLFAWSQLPAPKFGWPVDYSWIVRLSPAIGNVDGDANLELVVIIDTYLRVLDLGNPASIDDFLRWSQYGHDAQRTFRAGAENELVATGVEAGSAQASLVSFAPMMPNPTSSSSQFRFTLGVRADVRVELIDVRGRRVRMLVDGSRDAGAHQLVWDGRDDEGHAVSNGVYFGRVVVDSGRGVEVQTRKITMSK